MRRAALSMALALLVLTAGCTVGPRYSRPAAPAPAPDAWKTQPPWQQAAPQDSIPKGEWWKIYNDADLNAYEQQLLQANQSLAAARDRLRSGAVSGPRRHCRIFSRSFPPTLRRCASAAPAIAR